MDADTLEVLWRVNVGTMMEAPPISYEVGGVQFIAVMAGGRPSYVPARYELGEKPELGVNIENSYNLWVFRLPQNG